MRNKLKALVMSAAGVLLLAVGATGVVVGGIGSFLKENTISVSSDGKVFDLEGREIGPDQRPIEMSWLRKGLCEFVPQACNTPLDWAYWLAFFGGLGVASFGWNLKERGREARETANQGAGQ